MMSKSAAGNNIDFWKDSTVTVTFKLTHTGTNTIWSRLNHGLGAGVQTDVCAGSNVGFDCGWVGTVKGSINVSDGQWHSASVSYGKAFNRIEYMLTAF